MRVPSAEIERVMGKNDVRYYLNYIHLNREKRQLVATNGHALALITLADDELLPEDTTGAITEEALKMARKIASSSKCGRTPGQMLKANGALEIPDGPTYPRPTDEQAGKYPDYERVIPKLDRLPGKTLTFNVDLLANLAKAICDKPKSTGVQIVTLHLPWTSDEPIVVTPEYGEIDGRIGVLMPARGTKHGSNVLFEREPQTKAPAYAGNIRQEWRAAYRSMRLELLRANGRMTPITPLERIAAELLRDAPVVEFQKYLERFKVAQHSRETVTGRLHPLHGVDSAKWPFPMPERQKAPRAPKTSKPIAGDSLEALKAKEAELVERLQREGTTGIKRALSRVRNRMAALLDGKVSASEVVS